VIPDFDQLVAAASLCEVFDAGMHAASPRTDVAVLTLQGPAILAQLRELLRVRASGGFVCMCQGDCTLRFHGDDGQTLATVSLHHAASLRWDGWEADRELLDGPGLAEWLAERGYARPLEDLQASRARAAEAAATERAWSEGVPGPVRHLLPGMLATSRSGSVPPDLLDGLRRALATAWPDDHDRCRALLTWYGGGTRRCSGHPARRDARHLCGTRAAAGPQRPGGLGRGRTPPGELARQDGEGAAGHPQTGSPAAADRRRGPGRSSCATAQEELAPTALTHAIPSSATAQAAKLPADRFGPPVCTNLSQVRASRRASRRRSIESSNTTA
jgi:hypothetical protein